MRDGSADARPRLVFLRPLRSGLPDFILRHLAEQVACLEQFFQVTVVTDAKIDYDEVCARHEPDLAIFESGVYVGPRTITNTAAHPMVPKLGFIHCDAYCPTRIAAIADMAAWGVEDYFAISMSLAEYTPEIANDLFVWPNFIDIGVYRNLAEAKRTPVLLTGSRAPHYPWRNHIGETLAAKYPTMTMPHGGWFNREAASGMVHGEAYARLIGAATFAPTCGTIAKDLVRKHLEIPAAGACLVTEQTPSVEAAGFVDMENCLFVDEHNVVDKVDRLFRDPERLAEIVEAGRRLVVTRHTATNRNEVLQWFELRRMRQPGQRVVQPAPFSPLELRGGPEPTSAINVVCGTDRQLLRRGDAALAAGRVEEAARDYQQCLDYHPMNEAELRLAICDLTRGRAGAAFDRIEHRIEEMLGYHGSPDPDPVEWAYSIRAAACAGRFGEARLRAREYPHVRHLELDRTRTAAQILGGVGGPPSWPVAVDAGRRRRSIHVLPELDLRSWIEDLARHLAAAGQERAAQRLLANAANPVSADGLATVAEPAHITDEAAKRLRMVRRKVRRRLAAFSRTAAATEVAPLDRLITELATFEDASAVLVVAPVAPPFHAVLAAALTHSPRLPLLASWDGSGAFPELPAGSTFDLAFIDVTGRKDLPEILERVRSARVVVAYEWSAARGRQLRDQFAMIGGYGEGEHHPDEGVTIFRRIDAHPSIGSGHRG